MLYVLVPSAEGETEVLNTQRSAVSPLTPFCKHCFAVEHENKIKKKPPEKQTNKNTRLYFFYAFISVTSIDDCFLASAAQPCE